MLMDPVIKQYIDLVCNETQVPYTLICSKSRKTKIREARQILIYVLYRDAKISKSLAAAYVNRNHSTAVISIRKVDTDLETNKEYRIKYSDFLANCQSISIELEAEKKGVHILKKGDQCLFWNYINEEPILGTLQAIDKAGKLAYAEDHFAPFRFWKLATSSDMVLHTIRIKRRQTVLAS